MIEPEGRIVDAIMSFDWDAYGLGGVGATLREEDGTSTEWVMSLAARITAAVGEEDEAERVVRRAMFGDEDARRQVVSAWRRVYGGSSPTADEDDVGPWRRFGLPTSSPSASEGRGRV